MLKATVIHAILNYYWARGQKDADLAKREVQSLKRIGLTEKAIAALTQAKNAKVGLEAVYAMPKSEVIQ
jgi:hypothetical protein